MVVLAIILVGSICLLIWLVGIYKRLAGLAENADIALQQMELHLASWSKAAEALWELSKGESGQEEEKQIFTEETFLSPLEMEPVKPEMIQKQEEMLKRVMREVEDQKLQFPDRKETEEYIQCQKAADCYKKMLYTGLLIYNDAAAKFNRVVLTFPARLVAGFMGFHALSYLEWAGE